MNVPFVGYKREYRAIGKEIMREIDRCAKNGDFVYRKDLVDFEKNLAKMTGTKYAIGTGSCTGAMYITLKACGIGPGDEVITVGHTYIATIDVIVHAGAEPVLIDVGEDHLMNPDLIEAAITPRTKAIFPVHLNGRMCDMQKIMAIARKHNLMVFEDAAQALGAKLDGNPAGSWGLAGMFSFYPAKVLGSYGEGGAVVTNDNALADKLYLLRDHGELPSYLTPKDSQYKKIHCFGYNTILDNVTAAILNVKLKYFQKWIKRRQQLRSLYRKELGWETYHPDNGRNFDAVQNFVLRIEDVNRDELKNYLAMHGIETLISWPVSNHMQEGLQQLRKYRLPETEMLSKKVLSLPMHPWLTDKEVKYVCKCIKDFYAKR